MHDVGGLRLQLIDILGASPFVEAAGFEASMILSSLLGGSPSELPIHASDAIAPEQYASALSLARRRADGEPLQYLLGEWEFMSLPFAVGKGVFIPNPDTEHLVQTAIDFASSSSTPVRVLDLCAGSGCVGISVAHFCENASVVLVELQDEAFSYLEKNIMLSGGPARCTALKADALTYTAGNNEYDIIVSNPPYISAVEYRELPPDVTAQPESALTDGDDGLTFYRAITRNARSMLRSGGMLAFEIGYRQYDSVSSMLSSYGYRHVHHKCDYAGLRRVVVAYN